MELVKLFCYVFFVFLLLIILNFVGQEFINHDSHVHRMMYVVHLIYIFLILYIILWIFWFEDAYIIFTWRYVQRLINFFLLCRCNTKWYNAPLKIQKFILFLIRKTIKSYKVDAVGLFSPCLEGLATVRNHVIY